MVEINFLGGAQEVGRLSILIKTDREKFLLDYGIDVQEMKVPIKPVTTLDGVFLSHAHLDHCGFLPELYKRGYNHNVYSNPLSLDLTYMLLYDSIKVMKRNGEQPHFSPDDISKLKKHSKPIFNNNPIPFKTSIVEFHHAGHVPGSSSILVDNKGKRIIYTGDINFIDTQLMKKADSSYENINTVICESTYFHKNHPNREETAKKLKEKVKETLLRGGIVLLPCFALGRTQEMLLLMHQLGYPIYLDGMGIEATRHILRYPGAVKNHKKLKAAFGNAKKVKSYSDRLKAMRKPSIVITTAGMLNGGPIHAYIKNLYKREDCEMILSGFQVPGTVGHTLLHTGRYVHEGNDLKPKFNVEFMDFSAHCGRDDLIEYLKKINPENIFPIHGDSTEDFAKELKQMGFNAHAPAVGEKVKI